MVGHLAAFHSDVDMETEDQVAPGCFLQLVDDLVIADVFGDELVFPIAEGVGAGGADFETEVACYLGRCYAMWRYPYGLRGCRRRYPFLLRRRPGASRP